MVAKESAPTSEEAGASRFLVGDCVYPPRFRARSPAPSRVHIIVARKLVIVIVSKTEMFIMVP